MGEFREKRNETIYKITTSDIRAKYVGKCALYDILNEHLIELIENIRITLGKLNKRLHKLVPYTMLTKGF